jgi:ribonuclease D
LGTILFGVIWSFYVNLYKNDLPSDLKFTGSVAIDTEAMGLVVKRDRLCLIQICSYDDDVHMVQIERNRQDEAVNIKKLLTDSSVLKIFHYARFDVTILNYTFNIKVNPIYCTKIASKLSRTFTDKHGLKNLCKDILGVEISKHEQSSDWGNADLSIDQLKYAAGDVLFLHKLKSRLDKILIREGKMSLANKCFEAIDLIADLELADINAEELFRH